MKKTVSLLLAILMLVSLCACGSSAGSAGGTYNSNVSMMAAPAAPMMAPTEDGMEYAAYDEGNSLAFGGMMSADSSASGNDISEAEGDFKDKIIYSADVTLETTTFDETITSLIKMIDDYKGWIESSSISDANYYSKSRGNTVNRNACYTVRIPSESFSALMSGLPTLGNVPYSHTYTENVTAQYYDTQARLTVYEAQEARLLEMLELAETIEDIIAIEDKLSDVRYSIESLKSRLKNWDRSVSYSTVSISVNEVHEYTPDKTEKISYGERLKNAFIGSIKGTGEFFSDLLVFLVGALPALVIIAVLIVALRPLFRKLKIRRREKREAKKALKEKPEEEK